MIRSDVTAASQTTSSMLSGGDPTMFSGVSESASADTSGYPMDINNDGVVDDADATMMQRIIDAGGPASMRLPGSSTQAQATSNCLCPPICEDDCPPICPDPSCENLSFYARVADISYDYRNQMVEYQPFDFDTTCARIGSGGPI